MNASRETKICLIRTSIVVPARNQTTMFTPPLGLVYVAGSLRQAGFTVQVIDAVGEGLEERHPAANDCYLFGLTHEETVRRIDPNTTIIGISFGFSFEWPAGRDLAEKVRQRFPDACIVAGGEHATAMPAQVLNDSTVDIVVMGEGEETMASIATAVDEGSFQPADCPGIAYTDGAGQVRQSERRGRVRELDEIPWPAWDLIPIRNYLDRGFGFGVNRGRSMPMMASRGCPYQCTFCSNPSMWTTRWIARDPDLLLDEMGFYIENYGVENFDFYDLTAIVKKSWIVDFCRKIESRGLKFTWQLPSGTRTEAIDDEVAQLLYRSGCRNMSYSPESGSPTVLERIKKKVHLDAVVQSIDQANRNRMNIKCNLIFGFPGETVREIFQSYRFTARMAWAGAYDLSIWAFSPYPGSELFDEIVAKTSLVMDDAYYDSLRSYADTSSTVSYSEHVGDKALKYYRTFGVMLFYLVSWTRRPNRPFKIIRNLMRGTQESRAEQGLQNLFRRWRLGRRERSEKTA
jgi:anaerobic magnesium-protoporphyrin IX monomethyl ester cyclase